MDNMTATTFLTRQAERAIGDAAEARARLAAALGESDHPLDELMQTVLSADAEAKPWDRLMQRIERIGVRAGLAKVRAEATETLIGDGVTMTSGLVTNAKRLAEQEGLRRFLRATATVEIDDETPAE